MDGPADRPRTRWAYGASIREFLVENPLTILGALVDRSWAEVTPSDRTAWLGQIDALKRELKPYEDKGYVYFEYDIPRLGKRIDNVVLVDHALFVLEFKVGRRDFPRAAADQVWDYALDLKYFQSACREVPIVPVLVATDATHGEVLDAAIAQDGVLSPMRCSSSRIGVAIAAGLNATKGQRIDPQGWESGRYQPTPTIIEAARVLYSTHGVADITRHGAGADNLRVTGARVNALIEQARLRSQKLICLVTGVPGAGKTLVGLDVATKQSDATDGTHSVFLSGNGPLVAVLQEALANDRVQQAKDAGSPIKKGDALRKVKSFIQIVHHFRDDCLADESAAPANHVALFDEAQRAWDLAKTAQFMKSKKGAPNFDQSEPEFLISCLDRHKDWAVVVCLVGNGQEINQGEAGIGEWLRAIHEHFPNWHVHLSPQLNQLDPGSLELLGEHASVQFDEALHLATSVRSFRSAHVSTFANSLLALDDVHAASLLEQISSDFPIVLTRDIHKAKAWLRERSRGTERHGIVASSNAQRLRPLGIDVRVKTDPVHWFLNDAADVRSSNHLEDVASEFQVQGLELDWTCVVWDADLRLESGTWGFYDFVGTKWQHVRQTDARRYLLNAYRVLLTRARQGMVIVVPRGDITDNTRKPAFYDGTFRMLVELGVPLI